MSGKMNIVCLYMYVVTSKIVLIVPLKMYGEGSEKIWGQGNGLIQMCKE